MAKVQARIERLIGVTPGDIKPVGAGVLELRINYGLGYRLNYLQRGTVLIILLAGGDKSSQAKDIDAAPSVRSKPDGGDMMKTRTTPYDVAEHPRTPEEMAAYLEACIEEADGDPVFITKALGDIARVLGMSQLARDAGLSRERLYKSLFGERSHSFAPILKAVSAIGLKLSANVKTEVEVT